MLKRIATLAAGIVGVLVLLLSINVLANSALRGARMDLTENKLYTLSEGTNAVLSKIDEPISLRLFFTKEQAEDYPHIVSYQERVEELLLEYSNRAGGKLSFEKLNPEPFSEIEDRAVQYGLQGVPVPSGEVLYFGLAGSNTIGDEESIPFFDPNKEEFLEYDLTKLVHQLSNPEKLTIGLLSSLPVEGGPSNPLLGQAAQPWFIVDQLRQQHEVRTVMPGADKIPAEVGVLVVIHPKDLPDQTLYAIDQFVLGAGRETPGKVIAFVDPYCEADEPPADPENPLSAMMAPRASTLGPLFDAWGVELVAEQLAADRLNALSVTFNNRGRPEPMDYVLYIQLGEDQFNSDEVASRDLKNVRMGTPGLLRPIPEATTTLTSLLQTSAEFMQVPVSAIQFQPNPPELLANFVPAAAPATLAARINGPAKSAFAAGNPTAGEGADPLANHAAEADDINVVLVSDVDMLTDPWWIRVQSFAGMRLGNKLADNGDFLVNLIDQMQGSTDMISLRSRGGSEYPFTVVEELQLSAEQAFRSEEQALVEAQDATNRRLNELQSQKDGDSLMMLSPEQEAEIDRLTEERMATRSRLREVRLNLDKDVDALGARLKWLNTIAVPALVLLFALIMFVTKLNRRTQS